MAALAVEEGCWQISAALDTPQSGMIGRDIGELAGMQALNVPVTDHLPPPEVPPAESPAKPRQSREVPPAGADSPSPAESARLPAVMIDFSLPGGLEQVLQLALQHRLALVIGTTGLTEQHHQAIDRAAAEIPVLQAPNMSVGVNIMIEAVSRLARQLGDSFDIEIIETHHRFKKDAPSGTADALARAVCGAMGRDVEQTLVFGRHGVAERKPGEVGVHAVRSGDVVGRHIVSFAALGEELQVIHQASNRDLFARGALRAASWLVNQPAGRYDMRDVLGLDR